ncbi:MAG: sigma-70 family RNA polymerase sigma factor [Bacteroidales bacterium]|nr:sigma-70 family RNA polymerase sigma factor [Bacteroidales bacterium]
MVEINKEQIIDRFGEMVSAISRRMIQNKELAKEAAQEVWYEVLKNIHSFKGHSELSTWIYTIASRTILRYAKNEKISTIFELEKFRELPEITYDGTEEEEEHKAWIRRCCDWCLTAQNHCLDNHARLIFIFKINIDLSYWQISEIMEMKEVNIRKILSRSVQKISHFMNDTCPLYNPSGTCKCRIRKHVRSVDLDKEYAATLKIIRFIDVYRRADKELPKRNYWEKILS